MMLETDSRHSSARTWTILLVSFVAVFTVQSLLLVGFETMGYLKVNLLMQLALLLMFFVWTYQVSGKYLNAPVILIGAIYIWHSPFLTGHYFELAESFAFTGRHFTYGEEFVPRATGLVALCIASGVAGTIFGYLRQHRLLERGEITVVPADETASLHIRAKRVMWAAFLGYGLLTLVYLLKEGLNTFSGDYFNIYLEHPDTFLYRAYTSTKYSFSLLLLAVFAFSKTRKEYRYAFSITLAVILIQFLLGTRSLPFINLVALLFCVDYFIVRLPLFFYPIGILLMSAISFIVVNARVEGLGFQVFKFGSTGKELDLLYFLWELGGVIRNVIRTMVFIVPGGFAHGLTFLDAFVYLLPKFYLDGLGYQSIVQRPSEWIIEHSGDIPYGGGIGYSLVAEAYYNFGMPGCLLFAFIGWFVARNYFKYVLTGDRFSLLHSLNIVTILSLHMRNDVIGYMRFIVYGSLFIELLRWIDRRNRFQFAAESEQTFSESV